MKPAKSWAHLVATAQKKGVVINKGMQGMATISFAATGERLWGSRNCLLQYMTPQQFEKIVDQCIAELAAPAV